MTTNDTDASTNSWGFIVIPAFRPSATDLCRAYHINQSIKRQLIFVIKYYLTRKCGNYSCIATCSLALRWNSLALARPPVGSHSLELAHFVSNSLELARPVLQSHPVFMLFLKWIHLIHSYQILRKCDRKQNSKMPPSGWIQLPVPSFTRANLPEPSYYFVTLQNFSEIRLSWLSYFDVLINIPNMVQMSWCFAQVCLEI